MFCYQCQETALCKGCTRMGVCGKTPDVAAMQDLLVYVTKGISAVTTALRKEGRSVSAQVNHLITHNLFTTITNANFDKEAIVSRIRATVDEKQRLLAQLGHTDGLPAAALWDGSGDWEAKARTVGVLSTEHEDIRSLRELITYGLKGLSAYSKHANALLQDDGEVDAFLQRALAATLDDSLSADELVALTLETGKYGVSGMALLDRANTTAYGNPEITRVNIGVGKNPGILVSGHDLRDLEMLLRQTQGTGVDVYTHSEMLPAHGYPELKRRYPHLKGNFGTAWQNQQREFEDIPAPILFTTNCIMPLRASYADRVFTTSVVAYPGVPHIDEGRDFSPVIEKALELGGYAQDTLLPGLNGGSTVTTGFARTAVLQHADEIVQAVRDGKLRHFFLVGGCDGTRPSRRYYTEFARLTPPDTILLTLACGKFRLNDLPLGTVPGTELPRILDVGQCNDAYSAIRIALALADAFGCGVNDLPLSLVLCWFEQKAVCILIALLALGIRNIRLGPTLPPFLSPGVVRTLQERYGLKPIATPEADLQAILGG